VELGRIARLYRINERTFQRYYKDQLSGYDPGTFKEILVFEANLGENLSMDDTGLLDGGSTVIGNKETGKLMALIPGTKAQDVVKVLGHIPLKLRLQVKAVSRDFASSYEWAIRQLFLHAMQIIDRFHVAKLVNEAVQSVRIKYRWKALEVANKAKKKAKKAGRRYYAKRHTNGDTTPELLARSRYLLFKPKSKWDNRQIERAGILFKAYPEIQGAYELSQGLREIYEQKIGVKQAKKLIQQWYKQVEESKIEEMQTSKETIKSHEVEVLNFFHSRETNAFGESLNAKLKRFRGMCRGITDKKFFLFRVVGYFS
jgi:transposase